MSCVLAPLRCFTPALGSISLLSLPLSLPSLSISLSPSLSIYQSIYLSISLSPLSIYLSIYLSPLSIYLSIYLSLGGKGTAVDRSLVFLFLRLRLSHCVVEAFHLPFFARFRALTLLDLSRCALLATRDLLALPGFLGHSLTSLNLAHSTVDDDGLRALAQRPAAVSCGVFAALEGCLEGGADPSSARYSSSNDHRAEAERERERESDTNRDVPYNKGSCRSKRRTRNGASKAPRWRCCCCCC